MIKNYIFDLGHVLTVFDAFALTRACGCPEDMVEEIALTVFDRLYWDRLDAGTITDEEVKAGFCSRLPEKWHALALRVYDSWIENLTPIKGMPELIADIKAKGGRVFLLSNTSKGLAEGYHKSPWMKELFSTFDGLCVSAVIGLTKPDRQIYEYVLNKYGLLPQETMFIDDNAKNIEGCEAAGICGYLFDADAEKLRRELEGKDKYIL